MSNQYPNVLAHGIAPFDFWSPLVERVLGLQLASRWEYFKQIMPELRSNGHEVLTTRVSFAGTLEERAGQLGEQIMSYLAQSSHRKVHIIGHSMGGLDARCAIATNRAVGERVASLTTIGTPHDGTPVADFWQLTKNNSAASVALDNLRPILDLEGFKDLTTSRCQQRNHQWREAEASNSVVYQTYCSFEEKKAVFPPLRHAWQVIADAGSNDEARRSDGLVPLLSQRWQEPPKEISRQEFAFPADHLNQIGWWDVAEIAIDNWHPGKFERQVRSVYVNIARSVCAIDA